MSRLRALFATLLLLPVAGTAHATLIGDIVTGEARFDGPDPPIGPLNAVVGAGVEFDFIIADVDVHAESIVFEFGGSGRTTDDLSFHITDLDWVGMPGEIVGVDVTMSIIQDFNPGVFFGPDSVTLTLRQFSRIEPGAQVVVNLNVQHSVPEPSTGALLMACLWVGCGRRRKPR